MGDLVAEAAKGDVGAEVVVAFGAALKAVDAFGVAREFDRIESDVGANVENVFVGARVVLARPLDVGALVDAGAEVVFADTCFRNEESVVVA